MIHFFTLWQAKLKAKGYHFFSSGWGRVSPLNGSFNTGRRIGAQPTGNQLARLQTRLPGHMLNCPQPKSQTLEMKKGEKVRGDLVLSKL